MKRLPIALAALLVLLLVLVGCGEKSNKTKEFSSLEISNIEYDNGKILIAGVTDLPTDSKLRVGFNVAGRPDTAPSIGLNVTAKVKDGGFSVEIPSPNHPEFAKGPYVIDVMFTPSDQSANILSQVGEKGERLKESSEKSEYGLSGVNALKASKEADLEIQLGPGRPKSFEEADELKKHVSFIKNAIDTIKQEYKQQKIEYDQLRWVVFTQEARSQIDQGKAILSRDFSPGNISPENVQNFFNISDLYIKVSVDLIKEMWDDLDGSGSDGDVQAVENEIENIVGSIKFPN